MKRVLTSLALVLMLVAVMAAPAMAVEESKPASVTVNSLVSVTITDHGDAGLQFGSLDRGTVKAAEANTPAITIVAGSENNVDVEVFIKGTDFSAGTHTIAIGNAFYHDSDDSDAATAMATDYPGTAWKTVAPGASLDIYHWLSIPSDTWAGDYTSTFTFKAE